MNQSESHQEEGRGSAFEELGEVVEQLRGLDPAPPQRWEGKIEHPRQLLSGLRALLEDLGYEASAALDERTSPIRDVSYFHGILVGKKEQDKIRPQLIALGVLLLPVIVGIFILARANRQSRAVILIELEGESYLTRAGGEDSQAGPRARRSVAERSGVVGDARMAVRLLTGRAMKSAEYALTALTPADADSAEDLADLRRAIQERWPALAVATEQASASDNAMEQRS